MLILFLPFTLCLIYFIILSLAFANGCELRVVRRWQDDDASLTLCRTYFEIYPAPLGPAPSGGLSPPWPARRKNYNVTA
jgi:hypothetical protein